MPNIPDEVLDEVERALMAFDASWFMALQSARPNKATMGEIGALAAHHTSAVDFRSASNALARLRSAREEG